MSDTGPSSDLAELLEELAERDEFGVDLSGEGDEIASDRVDVATPAGRLSFDPPASEDYGADHERHDPDEDVYVNTWFVEGYTVVHTREGPSDDARHTLEVHEQDPDERAMELQAHGIPERRAEIAALRERGLTYSEIVEATGNRGPNHRGDVSVHVQKFNRQVHDAQWLARNADILGRGGKPAGSGDDEE